MKGTGVFTELPDGRSRIRASINTVPFLIPPHLKTNPTTKWNIRDEIWLNV